MNIDLPHHRLVSLGKYGTFPTNLLIGRPLYHTFDIYDTPGLDGEPLQTRLRNISIAQLNQEVVTETIVTTQIPGESGDQTPDIDDDITENGPASKNNRLTVDDTSRQTLSMAEIEELKKSATGSGHEIIEKIMAAHNNLDEKTAFSLAKYSLRKAKKFLRRFTILPIDIGRLITWMLTDRDAGRILDLREESLGLITAWSNVHVTPNFDASIGQGKWLVIDDTGGLVVAAVAERLGLLHAEEESASLPRHEDIGLDQDTEMHDGNGNGDKHDTVNISSSKDDSTDQHMAAQTSNPHETRHKRQSISTTNDLIYVLHPASQPNLSVLQYFGYSSTHPSPSHPLTQHLLPLSWLQLLHPDKDSSYLEPPFIAQDDLETMKSNKRANYYRKRRRWHTTKETIDTARAGGFDGVICATTMAPASILKHVVPLVKGGGTVVMYSSTIEPMMTAIDLYSRDRRTAFARQLHQWQEAQSQKPNNGVGTEMSAFMPDEADFPVDPRLLLGCSLQTSRAREWQILPGRTHPLMTSRGGAEGFVFTARKVLPVEFKVLAKGNFNKKRKTAPA